MTRHGGLALTTVILAFLMLTGCKPLTHPASEVVLMQTEPPRSMDPADHTATYTTAVLDPMYEGLTSFDEQLQIQPQLATAWSSNASGDVWTVSIRKGVFFHDGTGLDAKAVEESFERLLDPKRGLAGAGPIRRAIASVSQLDESTVRFRLTQPSASFPRILALAKIVSPAAERAGELGRHAVGTGPFQFAEWKTGEYVLEKRNERYWGGKPKIEQLKWLWTTEPALMNMALLAGEVDMVNPLPPVFAEALQRDGRISLVSGGSAAVFWIALNTKAKPLDDVRVRQALNYATDRQSLIASQLRGYGTPANSPLAPADEGYDPGVKGYSYDPEKARALLIAAGYPTGFALNIAAQESQANIVQAVAGMWEKVGVALHIRQMESGVFSQVIFGDPAQKAAADIQCVFASWTSSNLDPERQLGPLYRTESWSPGGANLGFYSNHKLDLLLDQAAAELDASRRNGLYSEAQTIISRDAPHVLLYYARDVAARRRQQKGFWLFPGGQIELETGLR